MSLDRDLFLQTGRSIGRRIAAQAVWSGDACTWRVPVRERSGAAGQTVALQPAGPTVYKGTAGIGLFLTELHRLDPDPRVRRAAEGAVAHALAAPAEPRTAFSFHSGRVGAAWAAARAGEVFGREDLLRAAEDVLRQVAEMEPGKAALDVVAGAAGGIPVLLRLARVLDGALATGIAVRLGELLVERAHVEPHGWAWGEPMQALHARHLCGLAHGASGMGHALLELCHTLGDARMGYGAEQAFAYERQFHDPAEGNWLDLRHPLTREPGLLERPDELRARLLARDPSLAYAPRFMSAWCHGAPGIALARLRAYQLTGRDQYRDEARAGIADALRAADTTGSMLGHSLCHGCSGLGVVLLHGARVLGRPDLRAAAERIGAEGAERFERAGRPWPGSDGGSADPGLMLGEAGIGYYHLQLCADDVPCVLLPTAPGNAAPRDPASCAAADARREADAAAFFARSLRVADTGDTLPAAEACALHGTAAATCDALRRRVEAGADARLADAFRLECARYEMTREIRDFCEEYLRARVLPEPPPVNWEAAEFRLAPEVRMVETEWDWDADEAAPPRRRTVHLLYRAQNRIGLRRLSPFAARVLAEVAREPASAAVLAARIADALSAPAEAVAGPLREQLLALYHGRLVECAPAAGARTAAPVPA